MLNVMLVLIAALVCVPAIVFCIEVLVAVYHRSTPVIQDDDATTQTDVPRTIIVMPAHNEADIIEDTLRPLVADLPPSFSVLMVADNCTDKTAEIARKFKIEVLERQHDTLRGKSYALDFAKDAISKKDVHPDVVIILDADCRITVDDLVRLASRAHLTNKPIQAKYLLHAPENPTPKQALAAFALLVKNLVRPKGAYHMGLPCQLTGTGMAFSWDIFAPLDLANGNIVEDLQLGLDLAAEGHAPEFLESSFVESDFPTITSAEASQRTRWEHGHIQSILSLAPKNLWRAITQQNWPLLAQTLDLAVPPIASYILVLVGSCVVFGIAFLIGFSGIPATITLSALCSVGLCILAAQRCYARHVINASDLLAAIGYVVRKIPLYAAAVLKPQRSWVRTERD